METGYSISQRIWKQATNRALVGIDKFVNLIRDQGHGKFVEQAMLQGFSLYDMQPFAGKVMIDLPFQGVRGFRGGHYFGESVDGATRECFGLLFLTDFLDNPYLYECQWSQGYPSTGKMIKIENNQWIHYEGTFDRDFQLVGNGKSWNQQGGKYEGWWRQGKFHGQGKYTWADGMSQQGQWKDDKLQGYGKITYQNGSYLTGDYKNGLPDGIHLAFAKDNDPIESRTYNQGILIKEPMRL
ncbi:hypothetical protein FGO68_gene2097 [Halteria grandinella]|uniref:MORN repeat protein n=1 Tax=Halteria grandinella TaxID=5974 RepID=A0A8J8NCW3_HALGN|nr:hypothetical protein FGO68_gene2097 [Halteria grandinella]